MFMKIGWHIWKPATCWLQQEEGVGEKSRPSPDVILSWNVLKTHQAHEEDTVKKAPDIQRGLLPLAHAWELH